MQYQVSYTFLIAQYNPVYVLCWYLSITHFLSLTSYMNPLTIKRISMISQTQNNEAYNLIKKYCVWKLYHVLSINHAGKTQITFQRLRTTRFSFMRKDQVFLNLLHTTMYNLINKKQPLFSFNFVRMRTNLLPIFIYI